jgi:hypothetical protein
VNDEGVEIAELKTRGCHSDVRSALLRVSYWFVLGLFDARPNEYCGFGYSPPMERASYAAVRRCVRISSSLSSPDSVPVRVVRSPEISILPLNSSVRESMCIHACAHAESCTVTGYDDVQHSGDLGSGTPFYVFVRRDGYSPHVG